MILFQFMLSSALLFNWFTAADVNDMRPKNIDTAVEFFLDTYTVNTLKRRNLQTAPSQSPIVSPTEIPTLSPTNAPTFKPTHIPTFRPSHSPTNLPTPRPTMPTSQPTSLPTTPSGQPSRNPTSPSGQPSGDIFVYLHLLLWLILLSCYDCYLYCYIVWAVAIILILVMKEYKITKNIFKQICSYMYIWMYKDSYHYLLI